MLIYLVVFLIVEILAYFASKQTKKKSISFLAIIIVLIISIFGGIRDLTVGTDVLVYGFNWFDIATKSNNFFNYINYINTSDIGYLALNYVVSRFTNDIHIFLIFLQLICNGLVVSTLYRYRDKVPFWLSLLSYLCIFYCRTLNILRQSLAVSLIFYSIRFLENKQNVKFIISILLASLFHYTAFFAIVIIIFYKISEQNLKRQVLLTLIIIILSFICVFFIKEALSVLYTIGIINSRIYNYIHNFSVSSIDVVVGEFIFKLIFLFIILMRYKEIKQYFKLNGILFLCIISDFIFYQMRNVILYSDRLSFYFGYFIMLIFPQVIVFVKADNKNRKILNIISIVLLLGFWYYKFIYSGSGEIYPYSSGILGM